MGTRIEVTDVHNQDHEFKSPGNLTIQVEGVNAMVVKNSEIIAVFANVAAMKKEKTDAMGG